MLKYSLKHMLKYSLKYYTNLTSREYFAKLNRYTELAWYRCLSICEGLLNRNIIIIQKKPQAGTGRASLYISWGFFYL